METMSSGSKNTNIAELVEALIKDNSVIVRVYVHYTLAIDA